MAILSLEPLRKRIKRAKRDRRFVAARKSLMKQYKFAIVPYNEEPAEARDGLARIAGWLQAGTLAAFEALYEQARADDVMLGNATKLHVTYWQRLFEGFERDGPACDARLPPFERWWRETQTPLAAAGLASALRATAFAYRGSSFADKVTEAQWAAYNERLDKGREVLGQTVKAGATCPAWLGVWYDYGLQDVDSFDAFNARFNDAWTRDFSNVSLCRTHGIRLLPRWMGRDARDLESFARHAAGMTQDRFGDGMYALIYGEGYHIGAHEIGDTLCDRELMKQGFEDLVARYPGQSLLNRYAAAMYFAGDYKTCSQIFRTRLKTIVPDLWLGGTRRKQVEDALDTFYVTSQ